MGYSAEAGFHQVPDVLIRAQNKLGLDAVDLVILVNIIIHWWDKDDLPYPRPEVIAKRMGVSRRTIERRLYELEHNKKLIQRLDSEKFKDKKAIRRFKLDGLIEKLKGLGESYAETYKKK